MNEENTPSESPEVVNTSMEATPSLEDVINEFNFDSPAERQPAQSQQYTQPQNNQQSYQQTYQPQIDPFNEQQLNNYFAQVNQGQTALQSELQSLSQKLNQYEQREASRQVEADIKKAVDQISSKIDGVDPLMVELYLEKVARENHGFAKIWENRNSKPAALNKALSALTTEIKDKFLVRSDPQLAENQRAMSQFKQSAETVSEDPFQDKWATASESEKDQMWAALKNGG